MIKQTSLAERLHLVFENFFNTTEQRLPAFKRWEQVFDLKPDQPEYATFIKLLLEALNKIETQISTPELFGETSKQNYLTLINQLRACCIPPSYNQPMEQHKKSVTKDRLELLMSMHDILGRSHPIVKIQDDEFSKEREQLDKILKDLNKTETDKEFSSFITVQINLLKFAFNSFGFLGMEVIYEVYFKVMMEMASAESKYGGTDEKNKNNTFEKIKSLIESVSTKIKKANQFINQGKQFAGNTQGVIELITSLSEKN